MTEILERIPPQAMESEQAALGAMLLEREAIETALEILKPADFYRENNKIIFTAIADLYTRGEPVDLITLGQHLSVREQLDIIGGTLYLQTIMSQCPTPRGITHYAGIIKAKAYQRAVIHAADRIMHQAYTWTDAPDTLQDRITDTFASITPTSTQPDFMPTIHQLATIVAQQKIIALMTDTPTGMTTGWPRVDAVVNPLRRKQIIVIAGRPGSGKTTWLLNLVHHLASEGNAGVLYSKEMADTALVERDIIGYGDDWVRQLSHPEYVRQYKADIIACLPGIANRYIDMPIKIVDQNISAASIRKQLQRENLQRKRGKLSPLKWFAVDYLQLLATAGDDSFAAVTRASLELTNIAKDLDLTLLICSQLSRKCEDRPSKRPYLSDLRQSGQIEQDADVAFLLFRPAAYDGEQCIRAFEPKRVRGISSIGAEEMASIQQRYAGYASVEVAKQRAGKAPYTIWQIFDGETYRFRDCTPTEWAYIHQGKNP